MLRVNIFSPFFFVFFPFIFAAAVPFLYRTFRNRIGWAVLPVPLLISAIIFSHMPAGHQTVSYAWIGRIGLQLSFSIDGLSTFFGLLISFIGALVVLYSTFYLSEKEELKQFYIYLMLFMGSMLGVVFSDNLILTFMFWEGTSISSFLLIGFWWQNERSRYGAVKALLVTGLGGLAMLGGFLLLGMVSGTFEISNMFGEGEIIKASPFYPAILTLIFIGAAAKSAQFPFHIWLPNAMEAPTPISAYLHSATMVKAGLFLVARLWPVLSGTPLWSGLIVTTGLLTMFVGGYMAIKAVDLKALLAYSTISQLGMIMTMLGFGTNAGAEGAIVHIYNHGAFKAALFMIVGIIDHETGTRDLTLLGGLRKSMPKSFWLAALGCLSMAGIPPLGGFISKELFYESSLGAPLPNATAFVAVAASILTFAYSTKFIFWAFLGSVSEKTPKHAHEAPNGFLAAPALLILLAVLFGFLPGLFTRHFFEPAVTAVTGHHAHIHLGLWHGLNVPLVMSALTVGFGIVAFRALRRIITGQNRFAQSADRFSPNAFYDAATTQASAFTRRIFKNIQTGQLHLYLVSVVSFMVFVPIYFLAVSDWSMGEISFHDASFITAAGAITALVVILSILIAFFKERIRVILALGLVGFSIALLYQRMGAPDLALTQYLIETVSVLLLLLVFYFIPPFFAERVTALKKIGRFLLSALTGALGFTLTYDMMNRGHIFDTIAHYYIANSHHLAGGKNIVNVIIVDFRGFDTMWEISVLVAATLGIFALLKRKDVKAHS